VNFGPNSRCPLTLPNELRMVAPQDEDRCAQRVCAASKGGIMVWLKSLFLFGRSLGQKAVFSARHCRRVSRMSLDFFLALPEPSHRHTHPRGRAVARWLRTHPAKPLIRWHAPAVVCMRGDTIPHCSSAARPATHACATRFCLHQIEARAPNR